MNPIRRENRIVEHKVLFEENGSEYTGELKIQSKHSFRQVNANTIEADGVIIEIDEHIIEIKAQPPTD